ncbi:MAG: SlyX family protein [Hyphomicrobium sp.]
MAELGERIPEALAARIDNLEAQLTYQDETIESLNQIVIAQWRKLDEALARISLLESRIPELQVSNIRDSSEETPPPHY